MPYKSLSTANLPDPVIDPAQGSSPEDYFNTVLYTGDGVAIGSGGQSITGVGFEPDWVWIKERSSTSGHSLFDQIRGATNYLGSHTTAAENTSTEQLASFDADGFTVGSSGGVNQDTQTYVAWNWKANGSGVSNTDGSITSQVSANTESGFSVCSYTGTGSAATFGHGLDSAPNMVIVKDRDSGTNFWVVGHSSLSFTSDNYLRLNGTGATEAGGGVAWNNTAPTSTTVSIGNSTVLNASGNDYIAYCFHSVEGFSKFGTYTGNGSTDGPFVYTGFRPAFVVMKATAGTESWNIVDDARNTYNGAKTLLYPNLSNAEANATNGIDLISNGFKLRDAIGNYNSSGVTYIYMAFAENPFKYSNAR
jgi:hypothetical protein